MTRAKRQGTLHSAQVAADAVEDADEKLPPPDPAILARELLIGRALGVRSLADAPAGKNGIVTVLFLPSSDWVNPVCEAWKALVRPGQRSLDGFHGHDWYGSQWVCFAAEEQPFSGHVTRATETFASSIAKGLHCLGVTPEPALLPQDMIFAADCTVRLPPMRPADVCALAERMCGSPPSGSVTDEMAAQLTPRLLRLARRPGQAADDYLRKLVTLANRDQSTVGAGPSRPPCVSDTPRAAPTLDRLHGMDEAVARGRDVVRDLAAFRAGTLAWADVDCGCLLSGPPGCGKTLFARALAASCDVPLVSGSYGQWLGSGGGHRGDLLKSMRRAFADAKAQTPSILFIDEIDSFPNRGTITHCCADWEIQVVNALLAEIDGVGGREGVVLIAACNHPDRLDPALVRSGRLDRHIRIRLPDQAALAAILREHVGAEAEGWDLSRAALLAVGSSGADCERYVRGARRRARMATRPVQLANLEAELQGELHSEAEIEIAAVHEAGHAVAGALLFPGSVIAAALRGSAESGGGVHAQAMSGYVTADDLFRQIVFALAGRAAEEVILGVPSSSAGGAPGSDLAFATTIATLAVGALGFDPDLGLLWHGMPDAHSLRDIMAAPGIGESVSRLLKEAYDQALGLTRTQRAAVEVLATELKACRALDGPAIMQVLARTRISADAAQPASEGGGETWPTMSVRSGKASASGASSLCAMPRALARHCRRVRLRRCVRPTRPWSFCFLAAGWYEWNGRLRSS